MPVAACRGPASVWNLGDTVGLYGGLHIELMAEAAGHLVGRDADAHDRPQRAVLGQAVPGVERELVFGKDAPGGAVGFLRRNDEFGDGLMRRKGFVLQQRGVFHRPVLQVHVQFLPQFVLCPVLAEKIPQTGQVTCQITARV